MSRNNVINGLGDNGNPVPLAVATQTKDFNATAAGSGVTISPAAASNKVRIVGIKLSSSAAASLVFAASGTFYRTPKLLADTPYVDIPMGGGGALAAAAGDVTVTSSAAANLTGTIEYTEEGA